MKVRGKVLESGYRENAPGAPTTYRFGWVRVLDRRIGEMVEVSKALEPNEISPFEALQTGEHFEAETVGARIFRNVLTTSLASASASPSAPAELDGQAEDAERELER